MQRKISTQFFARLGKVSTFIVSSFIFTAPVFADDLVDIFNLAAANDPEIRQARAEFDASHTTVAQSRAQLLPNVSVSANTAVAASGPSESGGFIPPFSFSDNFTQDGYGVSISQSLLNFETWYSHQASKKSDQVAAANLASAEQQLIQRVAEAYFNVLRSTDNLASFQAELDASERQLEQVRQRFEVGLIPITDVYEAQANFDLAKVNLLVEENTLDQRFEALEVITGQPHSSIESLKEDFPINPVTPSGMSEWVEFSMENNLDIKAAKLNYEARDESAKSARAAMYPTFDISAGYNWSKSGNQVSFFAPGSASENANITLNFRLPIYTGGSNSARKRQAYYNRNASEEVLLKTQRSSTQATRNSYRSVESDVLTVAARAQAIVSAQSQLEATEVGAEVGTRNIVDVVIAQRLLFQTLRNYANARYDYVINTLNLKQAAGILSPQDIIDLNEWLD